MDDQKLSEKQFEEAKKLSILDDAFSAFDWLLKRKYKITIAHNNKEIEIELVFLQKTFIHVAGINKLSDISFSTNTAHAALYRNIVGIEDYRSQIASLIDSNINRFLSACVV